MRKRTKAPLPRASEWLSGYPKKPGWYIASAGFRTDIFRWYNGRHWSHFVGVSCNDSARIAARAAVSASIPADLIHWLPQEWITRLWEDVA